MRKILRIVCGCPADMNLRLNNQSAMYKYTQSFEKGAKKLKIHLYRSIVL
jgi:hypothetical protein